MQTYAHIVAELDYGSWTAWFTDAPHLRCEGCVDWAHAVAVLIDVHGSPDLQWDEIIAIETTTRDNHAEFLIPCSFDARLKTTASVN